MARLRAIPANDGLGGTLRRNLALSLPLCINACLDKPKNLVTRMDYDLNLTFSLSRRRDLRYRDITMRWWRDSFTLKVRFGVSCSFSKELLVLACFLQRGTKTRIRYKVN